MKTFCKIKPNVQKYSCVNFPACIQLASDWFKNNQLLSELTHAQHHEPVQMPQRLPRQGVGRRVLDGEVSNRLARYPAIAEVTVQIQEITFHGYA